MYSTGNNHQLFFFSGGMIINGFLTFHLIFVNRKSVPELPVDPKQNKGHTDTIRVSGGSILCMVDKMGCVLSNRLQLELERRDDKSSHKHPK